MTTTTTTLPPDALDRIRHLMADANADAAGPLTASLIAGGRSNLTYKLDDGTSQWVLRTPPQSGRTPSAHDVAREFRVTRALAGTDVPVARAVLLCDDEQTLGGPFIISEFVGGSTIQSAWDLTALGDNVLGGLMLRIVETLAALHRVDHLAAGLERFGRPDNYAERQLRRWSGQWELVGSTAEELLAVELHERIANRLPKQHSAGIVHGDYRIDNILIDLSDRPRVAAVVDWELSTIGDPVADVAMMCAYRHPAFDLIVGEPSAWTSQRLPDTDWIAAAYEDAGGAALIDWDQHLALAYFKIAVIAAGIEHRRRNGSGNGMGFDSAADAVEPFLEAGLASIGTRR